ncbi:MAG: hypothetical protein AN486_06305 [Anabaena sp. AL93]|nr:MAG: hypothetical protein AN486_06305 [Anabaena sp. AL93]
MCDKELNPYIKGDRGQVTGDREDNFYLNHFPNPRKKKTDWKIRSEQLLQTRRKILIDQAMPYEFIRFTENPKLFIQQQFRKN